MPNGHLGNGRGMRQPATATGRYILGCTQIWPRHLIKAKTKTGKSQAKPKGEIIQPRKCIPMTRFSPRRAVIADSVSANAMVASRRHVDTFVHHMPRLERQRLWREGNKSVELLGLKPPSQNWACRPRDLTHSRSKCTSHPVLGICLLQTSSVELSDAWAVRHAAVSLLLCQGQMCHLVGLCKSVRCWGCATASTPELVLPDDCFLFFSGRLQHCLWHGHSLLVPLRVPMSPMRQSRNPIVCSAVPLPSRKAGARSTASESSTLLIEISRRCSLGTPHKAQSAPEYWYQCSMPTSLTFSEHSSRTRPVSKAYSSISITSSPRKQCERFRF
jgi:hypothetical protein